MKKIYLGVLACATIGIIYAFTNLNSQELKKGNEDFCIHITCNGKTWDETINAFNSISAREIAQAKYPNCKIGMTTYKGKCR